MMPIGILTDVCATLAGGTVGCLLGTRLSERWKFMLNNMLGISAILMGIVLILRVHALSPAIFALLLGAVAGEALQLEKRINRACTALVRRISRNSEADPAYLATVSAALVLFCFGGTGWYGSLTEGMTGDGSILVTKAILDVVTACIFGTVLGKIVPCLSIPQLVVYGLLFLISGMISGFITSDIISDFSCVGGTITLVAGLRLAKIKTDIPVLNLLPALILIFPLSALWSLI